MSLIAILLSLSWTVTSPANYVVYFQSVWTCERDVMQGREYARPHYTVFPTLNWWPGLLLVHALNILILLYYTIKYKNWHFSYSFRPMNPAQQFRSCKSLNSFRKVCSPMFPLYNFRYENSFFLLIGIATLKSTVYQLLKIFWTRSAFSELSPKSPFPFRSPTKILRVFSISLLNVSCTAPSVPSTILKFPVTLLPIPSPVMSTTRRKWRQ